MLKLKDRNFKNVMINMLKDLIEKEDKIYKQKRNVGQAIKIIIKWQIEILE